LKGYTFVGPYCFVNPTSQSNHGATFNVKLKAITKSRYRFLRWESGHQEDNDFCPCSHIYKDAPSKNFKSSTGDNSECEFDATQYPKLEYEGGILCRAVMQKIDSDSGENLDKEVECENTPELPKDF
jgi:hypothetical protein